MPRDYGLGRSERISFSASPTEADRIRWLAQQHLLSVSDYLRMKALENPIERMAA